HVKSLEQYGRMLGIAFQISDDLLDILGTEAETGKSLGSDFRKQKLTLPLIRLLSQAEEPDSGRIRELLSRPTESTWSELVPFLERSDAVEYTRARANEFSASARGSLSGLPDSPAKRILEDITEFVTQRSF
ncbi:MAG: polyprenyl synthetase family protein, partial [Planctomycetaceae bacterium]